MVCDVSTEYASGLQCDSRQLPALPPHSVKSAFTEPVLVQPSGLATPLLSSSKLALTSSGSTRSSRAIARAMSTSKPLNVPPSAMPNGG